MPGGTESTIPALLAIARDATGDGHVTFADFTSLTNSQGQAGFNRDGVINTQDLIVLTNNYISPANNLPQLINANGDGVVDFPDLTALSNNFGRNQNRCHTRQLQWQSIDRCRGNGPFDQLA